MTSPTGNFNPDWVSKKAQEIDRQRRTPPEYYLPEYYATTMPPKSKPKKKPAPKPTPKRPQNDRLKMFLDAKKQESVVLGDVARYLQMKAEDRNASVIHPSEMARKQWCPRATWLRLTGHVKKESHSLRSELIFGEGHAIHTKWQGWFREMGILYGAWRCMACDEYRHSVSASLPLTGCPNQLGGFHLWDYREVPLEDMDYNVAGHADGIITRPDDEYLVEIKSVGPGTLRKLNLLPEDMSDEDSVSQFSRITHAQGDHFRQTQIYLRLTQKTKRPMQRAVIVYEQKADQQAREFVVEYNEDMVEPLFDQAADIMWAIAKGREVSCVLGVAAGDCEQCRGWEEPIS